MKREETLPKDPIVETRKQLEPTDQLVLERKEEERKALEAKVNLLLLAKMAINDARWTLCELSLSVKKMESRR
jgi:hypothetical protein